MNTVVEGAGEGVSGLFQKENYLIDFTIIMSMVMELLPYSNSFSGTPIVAYSIHWSLTEWDA